MFLNYLKEGNKSAFLRLCVHAALSNGVFEQEEEKTIGAYCREMNIPQNVPDTNESLENVLNYIEENADDVEKKIIVLEILGLVKSDNVYDDMEKDFMKKLIEGIKVQDDVLRKMNNLLDIYITVYRELYATIFE